MPLVERETKVKVADEVFVAAALLHRENPDRADFTIGEIVDRAKREHLHEEIRPGLSIHVYQHCVANRAPNGGGYRMLYATASNRRRLVQQGDAVNPERTGKIFPEPDDLPARYGELIRWAKARYGTEDALSPRWLDGIFKIVGTGKQFWKGDDADEYVRRLREGWE